MECRHGCQTASATGVYSRRRRHGHGGMMNVALLSGGGSAFGGRRRSAGGRWWWRWYMQVHAYLCLPAIVCGSMMWLSPRGGKYCLYAVRFLLCGAGIFHVEEIRLQVEVRLSSVIANSAIRHKQHRHRPWPPPLDGSRTKDSLSQSLST